MPRKLIPAMIVPPGRSLKRALDARGWSQRTLAEIIGRPEQAISEIVNGKKRITAETALELGEAFGTSAEYWMNLERNYLLNLARQRFRPESIRRMLGEYARTDEAVRPSLRRRGARAVARSASAAPKTTARGRIASRSRIQPSDEEQRVKSARKDTIPPARRSPRRRRR